MNVPTADCKQICRLHTFMKLSKISVSVMKNFMDDNFFNTFRTDRGSWPDDDESNDEDEGHDVRAIRPDCQGFREGVLRSRLIGPARLS